MRRSRCLTIERKSLQVLKKDSAGEDDTTNENASLWIRRSKDRSEKCKGNNVLKMSIGPHIRPHQKTATAYSISKSLRVAHNTGALRSKDLKRVTVDTTVQPKAITFPTDAKLLHAAIKGTRHGVRLRQSYLRITKAAAMMAGRYAHAKQFKRHQRQVRILRSRLGRIIRDIRRKIEGQAALEEMFALPLGCAAQMRSQQQRQRGWKLYSFHAPEVECIGKGKASAPYEFGVKASIAITNGRAPGGQFVLHARALPDNPYDGHTLRGIYSPDARSSGPLLTRSTAVMTRRTRAASSSPARSGVSSAASSPSCAADPPSSP